MQVDSYIYATITNLMNFETITNAPPNSTVTIKRTDDSVEFSGVSKNISQEEMRAKMEEF